MVSIDRKGGLFLNGQAVNINRLADELRNKFRDAKEVYVAADGELIWRDHAQILSALKDAQIGIKLVVKPQDTALRR